MTLLSRRAWSAAFLLGLFGVPLRADEPAVPSPDLVFLLIGQSNMAGRAPLEPGDDGEIPGVLLLDADNRWQAAKNPLNRHATDRKDLSMQRVGPGDGFARRLRELAPRSTIGLVVNARGGSRIEEWGADQKLYVNTLRRLKAVPGLKLAGVLWHQGESNANDPEYLDKLRNLVERLRSDLDSPDLPWIAGQVYGEIPVNGRMARLPETVPNTAVVSAEGLTVFDGVHFDRKSQRTLGSRYADAWFELTRKTP